MMRFFAPLPRRTARAHSQAPVPRRASGFTLFELIIVIILVALLSGVLLGRFLMYQEMAEKTAMEQTAGAVQSALTIQVANLIARGHPEDIPKLAAVNPMNFMAQTQGNYVGEFYEPRAGDIDTGTWYYDLKNKELVYTVHRGQHFESKGDGPKVVRYKVGIVYNEGFPFAPAAAIRKEVGGAVLKLVAPYRWEVK